MNRGDKAVQLLKGKDDGQNAESDGEEYGAGTLRAGHLSVIVASDALARMALRNFAHPAATAPQGV